MAARIRVVLLLLVCGCADAPGGSGSDGQGDTEGSESGQSSEPSETDGGTSAGGSGASAASTASSSSTSAGSTSGGEGTGSADTSGGDTDASTGTEGSTGGDVSGCGVEADGCCSDLVFGGTDPDCPAFDCDIPTLTDPILLPEQSPRLGGTAMAWSGETLFTMRLDAEDGNVPTTPWFYVVEERDADGALLNSTTTDCDTQCGVVRARTSLAYHAATDRLAFTTPRGSGYRLAVFERSGGLVVEQPFGHSISVFRATSEVTAFSAGFAVASNDVYATVDGSLTMRRYDVNGDFIDQAVFGDFRYDASASCGPDCADMVAVYEFDGGSLHAGVFDAEGETQADIALTNADGLDYTAIVFDGEAYVVVASVRVGVAAYSLRAGRWSPAGGWLNPLGALPTFGPQGYPPSAVWTGQSVVMATQTVPVDDPPATDPPADRIHIHHLNPDGTLRSQFMLEDVPGFLPQLAYVDGRVAITWIRHPSQQPFVQERLLAFLECG